MKFYTYINRILSIPTSIGSVRYKLLRKRIIGLLGMTFLLINSSCEDFVTIDPPVTEVVSETVYTSDATAIAAIRGIYIEMANNGFASGDILSITNLVELSSDNSVDFSGVSDRVAFNSNSLVAENAFISNLWNQAYTIIYYANSVLEGLENSNNITLSTQSQLEGEAKFVRAFCHFYLVNMFGDIPVVGSTDFTENNVISRDQISDVYQQIMADLEEAQNLLASDYSFSGGERVQPNKFAATALLSRVNLYNEDWLDAEVEASKIIDNSSLYGLEDDLANPFLANSSEAIWQLQPVRPGRNTHEAEAFINVDDPNFQALSQELINSFEPDDKRRSNWIDSIIVDGITYFHPFKYKINLQNQPLTEYSMVFRLAEQLLIRAEARTHQNNIVGAQADLNIIRNRAGLPNTTANDQPSLLLAIERERQVELFTEWGHRWFDLKRTRRAEAVLSPLVLKDWQSTDLLFPIPRTELDINSRLTQNDGY